MFITFQAIELLSILFQFGRSTMNHRLIAFILLVTFFISTRAYFLRTGGKRGAVLHKKRSSLWKARLANTRGLKGK